jgi:hypothetical protein
MAAITVDEQLPVVEQACLAGADAALRATGAVPEPQVHLFIDGWEQPYVGFVRTRPYYEGADAVEAITMLGTAAASATATRVLLVWEAEDLEVSLTGRRGDHPNALVCVSASIVEDVHLLHRYPFRLHLGPPAPGGEIPCSVRVEWGQPMQLPGGGLPPVISSLLRTWRSTRPDHAVVFPQLARQGYPIRFVGALSLHGRAGG